MMKLNSCILAVALTAGAASCGGEQVAENSEGQGGAAQGGSGGAGASGAAGGSGGSVATGGSGGQGPTRRADKVDLLFMIDNSFSMADKQALFAEAAASLIGRLLQPQCVPSSDADVVSDRCPAGQQLEFSPVRDLHVGVISSSLGGQPQRGESSGSITGGCPDNQVGVDNNDLGHLIGSLPRGGGMAPGFLDWDGSAEASSVTSAFSNMVLVTGERGCGYEATLEAWYRFLIDPTPPAALVNTTSFVDFQRAADGTPVLDETLLSQRAAFLRPDSAVVIVMLSDENDCSIRVPGNGWVVSTTMRMYGGTSACDEDPNSSCCRSCALVESAPPSGCTPLETDSACQEPRLTATEDSMNVRCFDQKRRFGLDLLFPTARYVVGLTKPTLCPSSKYGDADCDCEAALRRDPTSTCTSDDTGPSVPNPLYEGGLRDPSLVFLAGIVGVPWQAIATDATRDAANELRFKTAGELRAGAVWDEILGDPASGAPPTSPFMVESIGPRAGIDPPEAARWANPVNSHEYEPLNHDDLQYACVFELPEPRDCTAIEAAGGSCACTTDNLDRSPNSPLCQAPSGEYGTTQYLAKGSPGLRELEVLEQFGDNSIVASVCTKTTSGDPSAPSYGYNPAMEAISARIQDVIAGP